MNERLKDRLILPIAIPLGALAFILVVTYGFGKLLLSLPPQVATAVAIMTAVSVLTVFSVLAVRSRLTAAGFTLMIGVASVPLLLGGVVGAGILEVAAEEEVEPHAFTAKITAEDIAFSTSKLEVPSGVDVEIEFDNRDSAPINHNIAIYDGASATAPILFSEAPFGGPKTVTYKVGKFDPGSYFFVCVVHPNMSGSLVASKEEGAKTPDEAGADLSPAESGSPSDEPSDSVDISADKLAFDTKKLLFPAGTGISLGFDNQEAQPHNFSIFVGASSVGEQLFKGEIIIGPSETTYEIPPLEAGSYYFQCDVHPFMNGDLEVG